METRHERRMEARKRKAFKAKDISSLPHIDEDKVPEEMKRRRSTVELCGVRFAQLYKAAKRIPITQQQSAFMLCALFMAHDGNRHLLNVDALSNEDDSTLAKDIFGIVSNFDPKTGAVGGGFSPSCGYVSARTA